MSELAYSLHLGSDKNRKNVSRARAKSNASGTTSLSNNAIQNARQLSRVDKHNYRKYDDKGHLIEIVRGTTSLYSDVQKLYKDEFEEARLEYNSRQVREDRKINDYFSHVSNNSKNDLACEIIIELGDKNFWDTKDKSTKDFQKINFKIYTRHFCKRHSKFTQDFLYAKDLKIYKRLFLQEKTFTNEYKIHRK